MKRQKIRVESVLIRLTPDEKIEMLRRSKEFGFTQLSEFIRAMALKGKMEIK
jgi:hypothetical protein